MKTTTLIALLAVVSAVSVGAISMNTSPSLALATGAISPESGAAMMGHVEYVVRDSTGAIKSYHQSDNMVVNRGDDCVLVSIFKTTTGSTCSFSSAGFTYIGIGNGTLNVDAADTTLVDGGGTAVATAAGGIMATKQDTTVTGVASSNGGTVTIATENPFTFVDSTITNSTTVTSAGLFDGPCTTVDASTGRCTANGTPPNMFSAQTISVEVTAGDSLDVTWTITVGSTS
ncbi:MAG: hypothetical protein ACW9XA_03875 [Candidatus Nitrosopumilus sp. bin_6a]